MAGVVRGGRALTGPRLDGHLHVWGRGYGQKKGEATPERLGGLMDEAGVAGALIVQPIVYKYDHDYVQALIKEHPKRYVGCLLANPTPGGDGVRAMEELLSSGDFRMVRFNPYLWPEEDTEGMANPLGKEMYKKAGVMGAPVGVMAFNGILPLLPAIEKLINYAPETKLVLDHFGFARSQEEKAAVLQLAQTYNNVYVKTSAFFRVAVPEGAPPPYRSAQEQVEELVKTIGASRCMYGSDFPFVQDECGYDRSICTIEECPGLSAEEKDWIMSGTLRSLLPGGWS